LNTITDDSGTRTIDHDPNTGYVTSIAAPGGITLSYGYDGALLTSINRTGSLAGNIQFTYDDSFRLTSVSVDGQAINYQYDRDGLLIGVGDLSISHDPQNGRLTGTTLGAVTDALTYNALGEVDQYRADAGGTSLLAVQYTRDVLGRITGLTETVDGVTHTTTYAYDPAGQLIEVRRDGTVVSTYTYDANGNRLSQTDTSGTVAATYDVQDRLLTYGGASFTYTAQGQLRTKTEAGQTTTYTYDSQGNLTSVVLPDGTGIDYLIDGADRRIGKSVNGVLVQGFLYDEAHITPVAELDGAGNVVARFVYATQANVPDFMIKGGVTYKIITDQLGSVRLVVDTATGTIAQRLDYDGFGRVMLDTNPGFQPFGFAGGISDRSTGLVRFGARDYDAETGRWTTKDPLRFGGKDTNFYSYAFKDPVNIYDPNGTTWKEKIKTAIRVVGVLIGLAQGESLEEESRSLNGLGEAIGNEPNEYEPDECPRGEDEQYEHEYSPLRHPPIITTPLVSTSLFPQQPQASFSQRHPYLWAIGAGAAAVGAAVYSVGAEVVDKAAEVVDEAAEVVDEAASEAAPYSPFIIFAF
jgi:RHS repeat-associated protein